MITVSPSALSDSALDDAYALSVAEKRFADSNAYASEIVDRLASPVGYIGALFGRVRFPEYERIIGFSASDAAQSSTVDSAGALIDKAGNAATSLLSFGKYTLLVVGIVLVGLVLVYIFVRYGGKK